MFSQKTRRMWAIALVVFVICASLSALLTVGADEVQEIADETVEAAETLAEESAEDAPPC